MRQAGGSRYWSLERNPEFAAVITSLVDLAGLGDVVKVVVGPSDVSLRRLHALGTLSNIDLMFLDHYKPAYLYDLKLCEQLQLVGPGSVLAADNVIKPGNPPYLAYVRSSVAEKRAALGKATDAAEAFPEKTARQYESREGAEQLDNEVRGDPGLIYQSVLVNSFEPTGVPVSLSFFSPPCSSVWYRRMANARCRMVLRLRGVLGRRSGLRRYDMEKGTILRSKVMKRDNTRAVILSCECRNAIVSVDVSLTLRYLLLNFTSLK